MIYLQPISSIHSTSNTAIITTEPVKSVVKVEAFFPTHTPAGAFLFALYSEGMIDKEYRIIETRFRGIPLPSFIDLQVKALEIFLKHKKIQISTESNIYAKSASMDVKADCEITLEELNIHLKQFAAESFGIILDPPILVGGYLRFTMLSSLEHCQSAFETAGLPNVKAIMTQELIDAARRPPPDADIKYMIPAKTPKNLPNSKDCLYDFTDEVVKFIALKMNELKTVFTDWTLAKNSLANFYVMPSSKVRQFGLVSFPRPPSFKIDLVFDKSKLDSNSHADPFYNLAIDLYTKRFLTPELDNWQGYIDMLGLIVHLKNPHQWDSGTWAMLLSYYLRGYTCHDKAAIAIIREKAITSEEGLPACLRKCWANHHNKDPYAALALTFQACLFLENDEDRSKLWREMSMHWINTLKSQKNDTLLSMIDQEIRLKQRPFAEVVSMIQALAFFDLFSTSHSFFTADIKKDGDKPLLQIKMENQSYCLLLPWEFEDSFNLLKHKDSSFFNEIYLNKGFSNELNPFLLKYKPFLSISWETLHEQAIVLLEQPEDVKQHIGYHLLLSCQLMHPKPEALQKLYSHLPQFFNADSVPSSLENFVYQLYKLISNSGDSPTFYPTLQFVKNWLLDLAAREKKQAEAACELWKYFFLNLENKKMEDVEILDILSIHHPSLASQLTEEILKNKTLNSAGRLYLFNKLLKIYLSTGLCSFERLVANAKNLASDEAPIDRHGQLFNEDWKSFFQELHRQKRGPEAAELLCALAKREFFNPDNQALDSLWLQTCHAMFLSSTLELTGKLAANIYKQRIWSKGWNDEEHIELLYKLSQAIFKENTGLGKLCLSLACKQAQKGTPQRSKICAYVVSYLRDQIISKKITALDILAKNPFKTYVSEQEYGQLAVQIKIEAVDNEFIAQKYETGYFLLQQLENDNLSEEQKIQLIHIQIKAVKKAFSNKDYKNGKLILQQLAKSSTAEGHFEELQDQFIILLQSKEGCAFLGDLLTDPIYSSLFNHGINTRFTWQLKCLKALYQTFKYGSTPLVSTLLIELLKTLKESKTLSKENFLEALALFNIILKENWLVNSLIPETLKNQLTSSLELILSFLRHHSQPKELHEFVQLFQSKVKNIELSENAAKDYLWSLNIIDPSPQSIGQFLLSYPLPEHLNLAITQVELLINAGSLSIALDLLKASNITSGLLWRAVLEGIANGKDTHLQRKSWTAFQTCVEKKQILTSADLMHCWTSVLNALNKSQNPEILSVLKNWEQLNEVFSANIEMKLAAFQSLVNGSLKQITNVNTQSELVNIIVDLDAILIETSSTSKEEPLIIKKLSTSSNLFVMMHVCRRTKKYLTSIVEKKGEFPKNISVILARLIKIGISSETNVDLRHHIMLLFSYIQLNFNKHFELLSLLSSIDKNNPLQNGFVWILIKQFIENEENNTNSQTKFSASDKEKCSPLILNILQDLSSTTQQLLLVNFFLDKSGGQGCFTAKDLMLIRGKSLNLSLMVALQSTSVHLKQLRIDTFLTQVYNQSLNQDQLLACFPMAVDLALELNAMLGSPGALLELFAKTACHLLEINKATSDFSTFFILIAEKAKEKSPRVIHTFFQLNKIIFEKIVGLNRSNYHLLSPKKCYTLSENSPFDHLLLINVFFYSYLFVHHLNEYHAQLYPLLPKYYFQRIFLIHEIKPIEVVNSELIRLTVPELKVFAEQLIPWGLRKYQVDIFEIRNLAEQDAVAYSYSLDLYFKQAVERVRTSDQLQIVLAYLGKINFNQHLLPFFELFTSLFASLKKDPFFKYEVNNRALCFLFVENVETCLKDFAPSSVNCNLTIAAHKKTIQSIFEMVEGFIELFETHPLEEQYSHLNPRTTFLNLACFLLSCAQEYHLFDIKGINIDKNYFNLMKKIFRSDLKNRKKSPHKLFNSLFRDYFELICRAYQDVDKLQRVKTSCLWLEEMSKIDSLADCVAEYINNADKLGVFDGFPEYRNKLKK
jgi:hypothetical protein